MGGPLFGSCRPKGCADRGRESWDDWSRLEPGTGASGVIVAVRTHHAPEANTLAFFRATSFSRWHWLCREIQFKSSMGWAADTACHHRGAASPSTPLPPPPPPPPPRCIPDPPSPIAAWPIPLPAPCPNRIYRATARRWPSHRATLASSIARPRLPRLHCSHLCFPLPVRHVKYQTFGSLDLPQNLLLPNREGVHGIASSDLLLPLDLQAAARRQRKPRETLASVIFTSDKAWSNNTSPHFVEFDNFERHKS